MVSKVGIVAVVAFVVISAMHQTSAMPPGAGVNPAMPAWIASAPWMPQWVACDPARPLGASCEDCGTKRICTAVGGLLKRCTDPALPHCDAGQCSAAPSARCAPAGAVAVAAAAAPAAGV